MERVKVLWQVGWRIAAIMPVTWGVQKLYMLLDSDCSSAWTPPNWLFFVATVVLAVLWVSADGIKKLDDKEGEYN